MESDKTKRQWAAVKFLSKMPGYRVSAEFEVFAGKRWLVYTVYHQGEMIDNVAMECPEADSDNLKAS